MFHFGFSYNERKKCYFSDEHENMENVNHRKDSIRKYFNYEMRTHYWVQITKEMAVELENDTENPMMLNLHYEYLSGNLCEYHIDTHPLLNTIEANKSIRCHHTAKQLIILRQDESCFKQYSFSKRC